MATIDTLAERLKSSVLNVRRTRLREDLLSKGNRFLDDNGFSRDLLELGNRAWPWRSPEFTDPALASVLGSFGNTRTDAAATGATSAAGERDEARAIAELGALSDAELADLDIARGGIADAVRYGRARDYPADRRAA